LKVHNRIAAMPVNPMATAALRASGSKVAEGGAVGVVMEVGDGVGVGVREARTDDFHLFCIWETLLCIHKNQISTILNDSLLKPCRN
jgi:hypothetical protein